MKSFHSALTLLSIFLHSGLSHAQITISEAPAATMKGIGASGAWWPIALADFPESAKNKAADLIFNTTAGLGISSFRFNVGGGGVFVGNPGRAPETFFVSPGVFNWSADPQGVFFLQKAADYGVPLITAFVNSAPAAFTSNGRNCGGQLVDAHIPAFSEFLAGVISHFKEQNIIFTHVSPMNEPDNSFASDDVTPCDQEGMIVTPAQRAPLVNALRSALDKTGLHSVEIIADESSSATTFMPEAPEWIPEAAASLGIVAHHDYGFADDSTATQMGALARNLSRGKETWFTEICCFGAANPASVNDPSAAVTWSQGFDPTIVGGLQLANLIFQSFTKVGDVHFDWWTALSSATGCDLLSDATCLTQANTQGWDDGLLYFDANASTNSNFNLSTIKRFFTFKHSSFFIRPGMTRHVVGGLPANVNGMAFKDGNGLTTLQFMNLGTTNHTIDLAPVKASLGTADKGWVTDGVNQWLNPDVSTLQNSIAVGALSFTTVNFLT